MKVYYFSEFPYHEYADEEGEKYPSLRLTFPNSFFKPDLATGLFQRYFDEWAASHGYTYVAFLTPLDVSEVLFDIYRNQAAKSGHDAAPDNFGYLLCCYVAETQEKADEEALHFIWRMGATTRGPRKYMNPVGYRSRAGEQVAARRNVQPLIQQNFEELKENYRIVCGTPGTMLDKLKYLHDRLGMDHLIMYGQESRMSHEATMANIGFFGKEVLPVIRDW